MAENNDARAIVAALAEHEEGMSALYAANAERFPQVEKLWRTLSREEYGHAKLLRSLADRVDDLEGYVDAREFDLAEIREANRKLLEIVKLTPYAGFSLEETFHYAVELESSLMESRVFAPAADDSPQIAKVIGVLKEETERHHKRLSEPLSTYAKLH
jgi:rubrerythrin